MSCLSLMLAISMHVGLEGNYNSIHPHARCQQDSLISGIYYNSEERVSAYVGLEYKGLEVVLVTGYTYGDILPMVRYKKDKLFIAPAIEKGGKKGLVIGIEF
jgi:hypothetical protein